MRSGSISVKPPACNFGNNLVVKIGLQLIKNLLVLKDGLNNLDDGFVETSDADTQIAAIVFEAKMNNHGYGFQQVYACLGLYFGAATCNI